MLRNAHRAISSAARRPELRRPPQVLALRAFCAPVAVRPLHLLLYHYTEDADVKREPHRARHLAAARAAEARGDLLLGGALPQPLDGAVLVFADGAAAEEFAAGDPYVAEGIVESWTVREWSAVAGSLLQHVPPPPRFPSYEWQRFADDVAVPAGLEVELPLDGRPGRARIPPCWQLDVWVDEACGFWRGEVRRETTVGELRSLAARHAGCSSEAVTLRLDGAPLDDDAATAEQIDLFGRKGALEVLVKEAR